MPPQFDQRNKWLNRQIAKKYNLNHKAYKKYISPTTREQHNTKSNQKYISKTGLSRAELFEIFESFDRGDPILVRLVKFYNETHNEWEYHLQEQVRYLIYTEFDLPNGLNGASASSHVLAIRERIHVFASFCSELRLIKRLHGVLYGECYKALGRDEWSHKELKEALIVLAGYRRAFFKRAARFDMGRLRADARDAMQNDLQLIIEQNSVSKADVIQSLTLIDNECIDSNAASIIAEYIANDYPYLSQPPPNPYHYTNSTTYCYFEKLQPDILRDFNPKKYAHWWERISYEFFWIKGNGRQKK